MDQLQQNFLRVVAVVYGPGLNAVRCYFDSCFPPNLLNIQLSTVLRTRLESLKQKKVLSNAQWDILFPANASTSSSVFDVALMTLLLRHFHLKKAPVGGYDVLPPDQDQTPAADLARIKYYRNFIAHSKDGIIDDKGYKETWKHLYDVVDRLGNAVLKQECELLGRADLNMAYKAQCEELSINISKLTEHRTGLESRQDQLASDMTKQETISRQNENLIKQFIEDIRSENEATKICVEERMDILKIQLDRVSECLNEGESAIPRNIKEQIVQQIKTWIEDEKKYVIIDASADALDLLKKSPTLTVAGNAGCGKTAFIRHLALRFMSQGYEIVPVIKPKTIIDYHDETKKQVFVLDDACGVHHIDKKKCMAWMDNRLVIRNCLLQSGALLLVSVRLSVFNSELFQDMNFLSLNVINLKITKYALTFKNRQDIFQSYLMRDHNELGVTEKSLLMHDAFPFLCNYLSGQFSTVANDEKVKLIKQKSNIDLKNLESFFHTPISFIENELQKIRINSPLSYCVLALCFIFNGKLPKPDLNFSNNHKSLLEDCFSVCGLNRGTPVKDLSDTAKSLTDVYLKENDGFFIFIHDIMMDIVSVSFGEHFPDIILKYAETEVIIDRLQLDKVSNETTGYKIYIPEKHHIEFFHRLCTEIKKGNAWQVFNHCQLDIKWVQEEMTSYLETLSENELSHLFFQVGDKASNHHLNLSLKLIDLLGKINEPKQVTIEGNEVIHLMVYNAFHWLLGKGHLEMLMLLERRIYSHVYNELSSSNNACTYITILGGNIKTYFWILNIRQKMRSWHNIRNKWFQNEYLMQDFEFAVVTGRTEFVQFLLKKEICQNLINKSVTLNSLNISEKLVGSSFYTNKIKWNFQNFLLKICCKLNVKVDGFEYHPRNIMSFFETSLKGCLFEKSVIMKFRSVLKPVIEDHFNHAVEYSSKFPVPKSIFEFLLGLNEIRDTYLGMAAYYGHESIVNLLLLKGANPNEISIPSNTFGKMGTMLPICRAAIKGRLTIIQKLLKHGAKIESTSPTGNTLLMIASINGHFDLAKFLLNKHVDINATNMLQKTALLLATKKGHRNIIRLLLDRGAIANKSCYRSLKYSMDPFEFMQQFRLEDIDNNDEFEYFQKFVNIPLPNENTNSNSMIRYLKAFQQRHKWSLNIKTCVLCLIFLFFQISIIIVTFL